MVEIKSLTQLAISDFHRLVVGYTSDACYRAKKVDTPEKVEFSLELVPINPPYQKRWPILPEDLERYQRIVGEGFSLGAFKEQQMVGIALAEPHRWNGSLWVWEFHVEDAYRGKGIGLCLMNALADKARVAGFRVLVLETQNTNVPAIRFYRKAGFEVEGIDLSYYSNTDITDGEIAIFMKRKIL